MVLVSPLILLSKIEEMVSDKEIFFTIGAELLTFVPTPLGSYLRLAYYRWTLQACSLDVYFGFGSWLSHRTARIGRHVAIGGRTCIGTATVGDHVLIGSRVSILSGAHQHEVGDREQPLGTDPPHYERVHVGSNTWIGDGAILMADVGSRCVVAAGAVVMRPVDDEKMVQGNPARAITRDWESR